MSLLGQAEHDCALCTPHNEMWETGLLSEATVRLEPSKVSEGMASSAVNQCWKQKFSSQCNRHLSHVCYTVSATRFLADRLSKILELHSRPPIDMSKL